MTSLGTILRSPIGNMKVLGTFQLVAIRVEADSHYSSSGRRVMIPILVRSCKLRRVIGWIVGMCIKGYPDHSSGLLKSQEMLNRD